MDRLSRRLPQLASPATVIAAGVVFRLAVFAFTDLPEILAKRPELAPPTTSFRSCKYDHPKTDMTRADRRISEGGSFHICQREQPIRRRGILPCRLRSDMSFKAELTVAQSPLYLAFFSLIIPVSSLPATCILWSLVDALAARALMAIWRSRQVVEQTRNRDSLVAAM